MHTGSFFKSVSVQKRTAENVKYLYILEIIGKRKKKVRLVPNGSPKTALASDKK